MFSNLAVFKHPTTYIIFFHHRVFLAKHSVATLYYSFISMSMNVFIGNAPAAILRTASSTDGTPVPTMAI
jgi:hypothetical protein